MKKLSLLLVLVMAFTFANAQLKTPAKASSAPAKIELPQAISDNIAREYAGFTIKDSKMAGDNYNVVIAKGATTETLVYDKAGRFIKKSEAKSGNLASSSKPKGSMAKKTPMKK